MKTEEYVRIGLFLLFGLMICYFFTQGRGSSLSISKLPPLPSFTRSTKKTTPKVSSTSSVEVHFVFAEWCGHSQSAIPEFNKLVNNNDVKTSSGASVRFIMTEESSPGMAQFKERVQGFPTYMFVKKENGKVVLIDELEVESRKADSIISAAEAL